MTIEEINAALVRLGWTKKELAERLHIHPVTLNLILTGKNKLTDQLAAHIELLLRDQQEQLLIFKVSYPDALCERWVPGWERLTEEQRVQAVEAVLQSAAEQLAADYERTLTPEDREMIHYFLGGLRGPAREFDLDAEEAAEELAGQGVEEHPVVELSFMNGAGVPKAEVAFGAAEVLRALADYVFAPAELVAELDERLADARKYVRGDEEVAVRVCLWKVRVAKNAEERAEARRELSKAWNELLGLSELMKSRRAQAEAARMDELRRLEADVQIDPSLRKKKVKAASEKE